MMHGDDAWCRCIVLLLCDLGVALGSAPFMSMHRLGVCNVSYSLRGAAPYRCCKHICKTAYQYINHCWIDCPASVHRAPHRGVLGPSEGRFSCNASRSDKPSCDSYLQHAALVGTRVSTRTACICRHAFFHAFLSIKILAHSLICALIERTEAMSVIVLHVSQVREFYEALPLPPK
jgi:hypothetical protein